MATTREPLTRLRIVKLALEIIDAEGLDSLNMRRLASAAGVKPMSLYHHYPNKEAILLAVAESISAAALGDAASGGPAAGEDLGMPLAARPGPSTAGDWRDQVRLLFVGLYELVQAHPRALPLDLPSGPWLDLREDRCYRTLYALLCTDRWLEERWPPPVSR
jgi:AcrR family transcriptional regulator